MATVQRLIPKTTFFQREDQRNVERWEHALEVLGEAPNYPAKLHNCTISSAVKYITPYECLLESVSNKSRMRIFGCAAHIHTDKKSQWSKMAYHDHLGAYLGIIKTFNKVHLLNARHVVHSKQVVLAS